MTIRRKPGSTVRHRAAVFVSTCVVLGSGGGGCSRDAFRLVPVSGTVLLDDQPLADGVINFQPMVAGGEGPVGPGSSSRIDDQGRFSMATVQGGKGAVVGKHRVKIYSYSPESPAVSDRDEGSRRERVPERYNYQSDLTFDVPAGGTDRADFSIESR